MLEAARRPALREVTMRWTDAYWEALPPLLAAAGSHDPRSHAELLLAAADGLVVTQLATGDESDLAPRLRQARGSAGEGMSALRTRRPLLARRAVDPEQRTIVLIRVLLGFESVLYSVLTPVLPYYAHVVRGLKAGDRRAHRRLSGGDDPGCAARRMDRNARRRAAHDRARPAAVHLRDRRVRVRLRPGGARRAAVRPGDRVRLHLGRRPGVGDRRSRHPSAAVRCSDRCLRRQSSAR